MGSEPDSCIEDGRYMNDADDDIGLEFAGERFVEITRTESIVL